MFDRPESFDFDPISGLCLQKPAMQRKLSSMQNMYLDDEAFAGLLEIDPVIYEFYNMGVPEKATDLAFGTSICYPGQVGREYYMTKGHFHEVLDAAEVYYCLRGHGMMMMETMEGAWEAIEMVPGRAVYVPGGWAHRSINIGSEPMITFFVFRADAGHDYATIEHNSFRKCVVSADGRPTVIDNPKWQGHP